jgi:hypothetical protein
VNTTIADSAAARSPPGIKIWYGILGAPVAFATEELLGWLLSAATCPSGSPLGYGGYPIITNAREILYAVCGAALLVSLGAFYAGVSEWRLSRDRGITSIESRRRPDFLAAAAMLVSAVFTLGVLWMSVPIFWLPQCQVMR